MSKIYLHYLVSIQLTSVAYVNSNLTVFVWRFAKWERCITKSITKIPQRFAREVAVSAVFHSIIKEIRQVIHRAIEGDRQFTRWIIVAEQHVCHGIATPFTRIPSLHNSLTSGCLWHESNGRARAVDKDNLLARVADSLYEVALALWQLYICAVATFESVCINLHFLALKSGRNATGKYNIFGIWYFFQYIPDGFRLVGKHIKFHVRHTEYLYVVNLYVVFFSSLHIICLRPFLHSVCLLESVP